MTRAVACQPVRSSPAGNGPAWAPVLGACAPSSAPAAPAQAPGPTPPGMATVPPNRTVWAASNATNPSTSVR
ncbi:hypothetical protein A5714_13380 [Mycobacterium sp. E2462]|nr:hypothetical protein A5714_13380 [Mycobacterium sp. E2462]